MKRTIVLSAVFVSLLAFSACGNTDTVVSEVKPDTTVSSVVTTTAPVSVTTTNSDITSLPETTTSSSATTTTVTTTEKKETSPTVTTTQATKQTTTTQATTKKKATTTTAKKTTTTTKKKAETAKPVTTTKKVETEKGKTMWSLSNNYWIYDLKSGECIRYLKAGEKVTVYGKAKEFEPYIMPVMRIKTSDGIEGYVYVDALNAEPVSSKKLTQSDIDKLVKELQEYSNSKAIGYKQYFPEGGRITYEEAIASNIKEKTPSNSSWSIPEQITPNFTYPEAYNCIKNLIDLDYADVPDCHIVVYAQWCPNGKGCNNGSMKSDCWDIYLLR